MAVNKINSRSPYYVVGAGSEVVTTSDTDTYQLKIVQVNSDGSTSDSPGQGTSGSPITLRAIPVNFTSSGTYTWTGTGASGTTADIDITVTLGGGVTNQEVSYGCSTTDSDGNTITATAFVVSWATTTQYYARLTITNNIAPSFSSAGYSGTVTKASAIQASQTVNLQKLATEVFEVRGRAGDSYSFTIALTVATGYAASPALAASTASFTGTFGSANVTLASTLTGTLALSETYILTPNVTSVTEGNTFTIDLTTQNIPDDTAVPFTITGISANDLVRNGLTGSFQVYNNTAQEVFEAVKDTTSEQPFETFTLTLNEISPTVSTSVKIYDEQTSETPDTVLVSPTGRTVATVACADTASVTAYFVLLDGQSALGNGVTLFSDQSLQTPYASDGKYYKIGSNNNGIIGAEADGRISGYVLCPTIITSCNIEESSNIPNTGVISSSFSTVSGPQGLNPCELVADTDVYYNGAITEGASLYTQRASDNNLSSPFGGTDNWYKLILTCSDGTPQEHYAYVLSYPPGYVSSIKVCGSDISPTTTITSSARVTISMSTSDGNNQGFAFVSQRVKLVAVAENITNPTYQWTKGSSSGSQSNISGETSSELIINEVGGGGETQTSAGDVFYNCKVSGVGVTDLTSTTARQITWEARPSFTLRFASTASASNTACTSGTTVTIHGDRDAITDFCVGKQFFANADGTGALSAVTYSNTTTGTTGSGADGNFRYIEASGIPQDCVNHGCAGEPASQPTSGIQKLAITRCPDQTNAGRLENILFTDSDPDYSLNTVLRFKSFGNTGGAGCYTVTKIFDDTADLPSGFFSVTQSDLHRAQPYGSCTECVGDIEPEEEQIIDPNKYYGAYRICGNTGGSLFYVVSDSDLPNVFRIGTNTQNCRSIIFKLHNNEGDTSAYSPTATEFEALFPTSFNDCATCIGGGSAPPSQTLAGKRTYKQCDDASQTIVFGHTDNLTAAQFQEQYPSVVYNGVCYEDSTTASVTSTINIDDLVNFRDCASCDAFVNPPPPPSEDRPSNIKVMRISASSASDETTACNTLNTYDLNVYYVGIFGDNTYLYSDPSLSTLYAPTSETNFRVNENRNYFKIGYSGGPSGVRPGAVYNFGSCSGVDVY